FDKDNKENSERAVKTQLVMDAIADKLNVQVGQNDLTERLVLMSRQYGLEPQQLLQMLQQNNQLPAMFADVRRGLTVAAVVHGATVKDTDGTEIDTAEFFGPSGEHAANDDQIAADDADDDTAEDVTEDATEDADDDTAAAEDDDAK
ncbi:MAG TPA: trigger factor, partial [Mycobacterium sp.]|nr:trigger factor [Mycobacterium sp.]